MAAGSYQPHSPLTQPPPQQQMLPSSGAQGAGTPRPPRNVMTGGPTASMSLDASMAGAAWNRYGQGGPGASPAVRPSPAGSSIKFSAGGAPPVLTQPPSAMTHPGQFNRPHPAAFGGAGSAAASSVMQGGQGQFGRPGQAAATASFYSSPQSQAASPGAAQAPAVPRGIVSPFSKALPTAAASSPAQPQGLVAGMRSTGLGPSRSPVVSPRGPAGAGAYKGPMPFDSIDAPLSQAAAQQMSSGRPVSAAGL